MKRSRQAFEDFVKRRPVLDLIKPDFICAEIGVWRGYLSGQILKKNPKQLYLIDPWVSQSYVARWYNIEQNKMHEIYRGVVGRYKDYANVHIIRDYSVNVEFTAGFFNWVYIDGDHSYLNVLEDLNHYYPLIKNGGFLCGDDYGWHDKHHENKPELFGGPKRAVDEFTNKHNLSLTIDGNQFIIVK
mgnify:CR=1 FL=1